MQTDFNRRQFFRDALGAAAVAATGSAALSTSTSRAAEPKTSKRSQTASQPSFRSTFSLDGGNVVRVYATGIEKPVKILQITDAHLFIDDERGADYRDNSKRMAGAYNVTRRADNGEETTPMDALTDVLERAKSQDLDAIVLTGDIISFPSAAGVDFVRERLETTGVPYYYVAGNHDWHFEGLPGPEKDLRDEWIEKRLKPLYPKGINSPLAYAVKVGGVKLLLVDDSIYEILPEQLDFFRREIAEGLPTALFTHIPMYAPGRGVGFGCGHPDWKAATDGNYKIERRPRWPEAGHTATTFAFRDEVFAAPNLVGAFAGHIHRESLDVCGGKPSRVAPASYDATGSTIEFLPLP